MTTKDVLALALEALESVTFHSQGDVGYVECDFDKIGAAITAIKQAITPETGNAATPEASAITAGNGQVQEPTGKQSLQVPRGYKLVPVEPTPEMINAGRICPMPTDSEWDEDEDYSAVYRAMLAAAPTPPEAA
jgi:hypothetical protein